MLATAYNLLIDQPGLDLASFADRLAHDEATVRAIFDRLCDLSLLHRIQSHGQQLVPVSPIAAMQRLIARERTVLQDRQRFLEQSAGTFAHIAARCQESPALAPSPPAVEPLAEEVCDASVGWRRVRDLTLSASESVRSIYPTDDSPPAVRAATLALQLPLLSRGVRVQVMFMDSVAFDPKSMAFAEEIEAAGAEVRLAPQLPLPMIIIDGRTVLLRPGPHSDNDGPATIVSSQEAIVFALRAMFDALWRQGHPMPSPCGDGSGCSPTEIAVVRMLASGAKDDAVARQLGTSVRTIRRIVGYLMERSGADSRFAFGVYAAAHGWI
jgi:DNA-binding CsgD family transcriptional regulator